MKLRQGLVAALICMLAGTAASQDVQDFSATISEFRSIAAVAPYFDSAYGYAVWRRIGRGGLGIGAATGSGQVYRSGEVTGISRLFDLTIGFQAGGQVYKQIVFFEDKRAYNEFTNDNFQFNAAASAVAVTASAQANAGTQGSQATAGVGGPAGTAAAGGYQRGLQVFTMSIGGLMYQATVGGQSYSFTPVN